MQVFGSSRAVIMAARIVNQLPSLYLPSLYLPLKVCVCVTCGLLRAGVGSVIISGESLTCPCLPTMHC